MKVTRPKKIQYHFRRKGGYAEYYAEVYTTRECLNFKEAEAIVREYIATKGYAQIFARVISIERSVFNMIL